MSVQSDGTAIVKGFKSADEASPRLVIPKYYNGSIITELDTGAFLNCDSLINVTIPDSVTIIGSWAFGSCRRLTSITIPSSVTRIRGAAFGGCDGLTSIIVEKANPVYYSASNCVIETARKALVLGCKNSVIPSDGSVTSIDYYAFNGRGLTNITIPDTIIRIDYDAFSGCSNLEYNRYDNALYLGNANNPYLALIKAVNFYVTSCNIHESTKIISGGAFEFCSSLTNIIIPDNMTTIGEYAFHACCNLTSISLGNGVTNIDSSVFSDCSSLTSITIPSSVTSIRPYLFRGCSNLTSIVVDSMNPVYHSENNCLIETATKTLVACCQSSVIPDDGSVTAIGGGAFYGCSDWTILEIPDGITSIGYCAFCDCESLTSLVIPDSVTYFGRALLSRFTNLEGIYYKGTANEWEKINIEVDNDEFINIKRYYYSETRPTGEGNYWHYVDGVITVWTKGN